MLADRRPRSQPARGEESAFHEARARSRRLGRPILASWTRPIAAADALIFFGQAESSGERALWLRPATGDALVGQGTAVELLAHGAGDARFGQIASAWRDLLTDAVVDADAHADEASPGPVLLGGFSFDPLRQPSELWAGFPEGRMVLPRRTLVVRNGATWLTTNTLVDARATDGESPSRSPSPRAVPTPGANRHTSASATLLVLSPARWQALVEVVARGIRHGQLGVEKVVLARAVQLQLSQPDPPQTLRRLAERYPSCTVFAVAQRDACFLGATPERLVTLRHGTASTMALAGSVPRGVTPAADETLAQQLLRSPKERAEHAVVVGALRDGLSRDGLCTRIIADAEPRVQKLPNLQHLLTPIRGQVRPGTTVLDLVERLHPTPAVGGYPRRPALELIRAYEALDRGWYGGPIGWLDRHGEGEFVVGIRSALLRATDATLFAGCGIVADSNPAAEYAESGWKLRPMLAALGAEP